MEIQDKTEIFETLIYNFKFEISGFLANAKIFKANAKKNSHLVLHNNLHKNAYMLIFKIVTKKILH